MRRRARIAVLSTAGILALLVLIVAGGLLWLASPAGRDFALRTAAQAARDSDLPMTLEGVEGGLFGELTIARLAIDDPKGRWLTAEDLRLHWHPWELLRGRLHIADLSAQTIDVRRAPSLPPSEEKAQSGQGSLPVQIYLDRLAVAQLSFGEDLFGRAAAVALQGRAVAGRDDGALGLQVQRLDEAGSLMLEAGYDVPGDVLAIDLQAEEPTGEIVAGLLGLLGDPALRITVSGEGPLSQWRGQMRATLDDQEWVTVKAAVDGKTSRTITADGSIATAPLRGMLPPELMPLMGDAVSFETRTVLESQWIRLTSARIGAAAADVGLSGAYGIESGAWEAQAELLRLEPALGRQYGLGLYDPRLHLEARGEAGGVKASLLVAAEGMAASGVAVQGLDMLIELADQGTSGSRETSVRAHGTLTALPGVEGGSALPAPLSLIARATLRDAAAALDELELDLGPATLAASGRYGEAGGDGRLSLAIADLAAFLPARDGTAEPKPTAALKLATEVRYGTDGLALDDLTLDLPAGRLAGSAKLDAEFSTIDAMLAGDNLDLEKVAALIGTELAGRLAVKLTASGAVADPRLTVAADLAHGAVGGAALPPLSLRADAATLASAPQGQAALTARPAQGSTTLRTRFARSGDTINFADIALSGPGLAGGGQLAIDLDTALASGNIKLDAKDLGPLLASAGFGGGGKAAVTLALNGRKGAQQAEVAADFGAITIMQNGAALASVGRAKVNASGVVDGTAPMTAQLSAEEVAASGVEVGRLGLKARGTTETMDFDLTMAAPAYQDLRLAMSGLLRSDGNARTLRIAKGQGRVKGEAFTIQPGLTAVMRPDGYQMNGLKIAGRRLGQVSAEGALKNGGITGALAARGIPMALLSAAEGASEWQGTIDLAARASGTVERPLAKAKLSARGVGMPNDRAARKADATVDLALDDTAAALSLRVTGLSQTPLVLDGRIGRSPDGLGLDDGSRLSGKLSWRGTIQEVTRLTPLAGQQASGAVAADMSFNGTLGRPGVTGAITVSDGALEDYMTGVVLRFARLEIAGDDRRIMLRPFEVSEPSGGRIAGEGNLDLDAAAGFPFAARLEVAKARLLNRDDITAVLSGSLMAQGTVEKASVTGTFRSETVEVNLDTGVPPSVTTIEVEERGPLPDRGDVKRREAPNADQEGGAEVLLDIALDMPQRVFVRGRGLDSEWSGKLAVSGRADAPRVKGQLNSRRGRFDIIGKIFEVQPSVIDLAPKADGSVDALLGIKALHETKDLAVTIAVTGPAAKPKLELSSAPALPQDEILSRLLFDKARASLSPVEALQLASSLRTLAGGGGSDPIATIRKAVGVDVLRVDSSDAETGPALEAGKYVTDKVYVGVRQGVKPGSNALAVDVDVLKNVSVGTETRQDGGQSVGVKYKLNY